jgi:hypothetical protein
MVEHAGIQLATGSLTREAATTIAADLESVTYGLAESIIEVEATHGKTRESGIARATLSAMDERLHWLQQNCDDSDLPHLERELQAIQRSGSDILALLQREVRPSRERASGKRERRHPRS